MEQWAAIRYRDFYDVPRIFLVSHDGEQYLFDCAFDDELGDYPDIYRVYLMPALTDAQLAGTWDHLPQLAKRFLGEVAVNRVQFDPTKRAAINPTVISELLTARSTVSKVA